jgi:CRISPR-associated protein Csb1
MDTKQYYEKLESAVQTAVAFRLRRKLQPAGGPGDKVFPPTYAEGKYAFEDRIIDNQRVSCVLLDSVQSQANRMETALLAAHREKKFALPVIAVDFRESGFKDIGVITSLETPHRIADAILRDSETSKGNPFPDTAPFNEWKEATNVNATPLFAYCPTALLFGLWFNESGGPGGIGTRFQRAIVSEVVGVGVVRGVATGGQSNPLNIYVDKVFFNKKAKKWNNYEGKNQKDSGVKEVKLSEINHGSITPDFSYARIKNQILLEDNGKPRIKGGVTMGYALQMSVLSLPALRKLSFPVKDSGQKEQPEVDTAARAVLAALGLCGAISTVTRDFDLRSRCLLVPEGPAEWEMIGNDGSSTPFNLSFEDACELTRYSIEAAKSKGLPWHDEGVMLTPNSQLVELVNRSRMLRMESVEENTGE